MFAVMLNADALPGFCPNPNHPLLKPLDTSPWAIPPIVVGCSELLMTFIYKQFAGIAVGMFASGQFAEFQYLSEVGSDGAK